MRHLVPRKASLACCALLVALLATPGADAAGSSGSAETANTILSLSVAGSEVVVGADAAEATRGGEPYARAAFTAGRSADTTLGSLERTGSASDDSGSDELADDDVSVPGLVSLDLVDAAATIDVADDRVASSADATLAGVELFDGLVTLQGLTSSAGAEVTTSYAEASRTITLDGLQVFDLAGLLAAMGVDRLEVPCAGLEATASALGVDADQACEQLAAAEAALTAARDDLDAIADDLDAMTAGHDREDVEADRAAVAALSCGALDVACIASALTTLTTMASTYDVSLSDPTSLATSKTQVLAGQDELLAAFDDREVIADAVVAAGLGTCTATDDALGEAEAGLSDEDPAGAEPVLIAARSEADERCDTLGATVDETMSAPVVRMDDIVITLTARAGDGDTASGVAVTIGSVQVGLNEAVAVADVTAGLAAADAIAEEIAAVVDGLMLGAATPEIELFAVDTADGAAEDGSFFADASLAILQITQPAGSLDVPDEAPFAILGDGAGSLGVGGAGVGLGAAPRALLAAMVDSPPIVARAVVFDAAASFAPASVSGGPGDDTGGPGGGGGTPGKSGQGDVGAEGSTLPVTGVAYKLLTILAAAMLVLAESLRRWLGYA